MKLPERYERAGSRSLFLERLQTFGLGDLGDLCIRHVRVTTIHKVRSGDSTHLCEIVIFCIVQFWKCYNCQLLQYTEIMPLNPIPNPKPQEWSVKEIQDLAHWGQVQQMSMLVSGSSCNGTLCRQGCSSMHSNRGQKDLQFLDSTSNGYRGWTCWQDLLLRSTCLESKMSVPHDFGVL